MNSCAPEIRSYRILGVVALLHAAALIGLLKFVYTADAYNQGLARAWVVATALWLVWPLILLLHRGRSVRLFTTIAVPAALIYAPSFTCASSRRQVRSVSSSG